MILHNILNAARIPQEHILKKSLLQVTLNRGWRLEQLKERTVLKLRGEKCREFLQGLITNDINLLCDQHAIYAMLLNVKGRILYDTIIYKTDCENSFLLECDTSCVSDVEKYLKLYRVRRKIDITSGEHKVYAVFKPKIEEKCDLKLELSENYVMCPDPRLCELGFRAVFPCDANLINNLENDIEKSYKMYRYNLGIAEGTEEIPIGKCFPLEMNCDYLNGVSFNKGCYIGQELTARTFHTGVVRKRLMPLYFTKPPDENVVIDDTIVDSSSSKPHAVGKLRGIISNLGLGLMRVTETLTASTLEVRSIGVSCTKPTWWPTPSEQMH